MLIEVTFADVPHTESHTSAAQVTTPSNDGATDNVYGKRKYVELDQDQPRDSSQYHTANNNIQPHQRELFPAGHPSDNHMIPSLETEDRHPQEKALAPSAQAFSPDRKVMITPSQIVNAWTKPVQGMVEAAIRPIREFLSLPSTLPEIQAAIKNPGDWALHLMLLCCPRTSSRLRYDSLTNLLGTQPKSYGSVRYDGDNHWVSMSKVIANASLLLDEIDALLEASH